ncbi:hypothetical protein [Catenulispora acidiphila]|nr:hypothetical protein [Catenulispora acidiphila]
MQLSPVRLTSVGRASVVVGCGAGQRAACAGVVGCWQGLEEVGLAAGADE